MLFIRVFSVVVVSMAVASSTEASPRSKAVVETVEWVAAKFGAKAVKGGAAAFAQRVETQVARHGDEVLLALRKGGPVALEVIEKVEMHGGQVAKFYVRHGEGATWVISHPGRTAIFIKHGPEAGEVLVRYGPTAVKLIDRFEKPAVTALGSLTKSGSARRLAMTLEENAIPWAGHEAKVLAVICQYGEKGLDFVWRNKGALAVATTLAVFLADPEPFINGTRILASTVVEQTLAPIAGIPGQVSAEVARSTNWTVVALALVGAFAGLRIFTRLRQAALRSST